MIVLCTIPSVEKKEIVDLSCSFLMFNFVLYFESRSGVLFLVVREVWWLAKPEQVWIVTVNWLVLRLTVGHCANSPSVW